MAPRIAQPDQYLLTLYQMAHELAVSHQHLRNLVERNEIPFVKLGKSLRFEREAVRRAIAAKMVAAAK